MSSITGPRVDISATTNTKSRADLFRSRVSDNEQLNNVQGSRFLVNDTVDGMTTDSLNFKMPHIQTLSSNIRYGQTIQFSSRNGPILLQNNRKVKPNSKMLNITNKSKFENLSIKIIIVITYQLQLIVSRAAITANFGKNSQHTQLTQQLWLMFVMCRIEGIVVVNFDTRWYSEIDLQQFSYSEHIVQVNNENIYVNEVILHKLYYEIILQCFTDRVSFSLLKSLTTKSDDIKV